MVNWTKITSEEEHKTLLERYEEIKHIDIFHNEYVLLASLISDYENETWSLPDLSPEEVIRVKKEEGWN